jgi:epoxyqueuosine reductase
VLDSAAIKAHARDLGFDLCGIAPADPFHELAFLTEWLASGYAGTMQWMHRSAERRSDVRQVVPTARSVVVIGSVYNTDGPYSVDPAREGQAFVSRYAWGRDYHDVIGARLQALLAWMRSARTDPFDARWYVDTGPVQERVYAKYAGLGWLGKNTCLINPSLGSWLFLGVIITSLDLETDAPVDDYCGSCMLCIQSCPTGALVQPGVLDARACISYLTIEHRGPIAPELRDGVGTHVYGCDVCQEVCPWNARPAVSSAAEWLPQPPLAAPSLLRLWEMPDAEVRALLRAGPMARTKVTGFRRNLALAIGNAAGRVPASALEVTPEALVDRPSLGDPVVADAIGWATARLGATAAD